MRDKAKACCFKVAIINNLDKTAYDGMSIAIDREEASLLWRLWLFPKQFFPKYFYAHLYPISSSV